MKDIKNFFKDNGYEIHELNHTIEGWNDDFQIMVVKRENDYLVRMAVRCYFDRWANSGTEKFVGTEKEVIDILQSDEFISDAIAELVLSIVEECRWDKDYSRTSKMISALYDILENKS